jgi:hypothetical protein
MRLCSKPAAGKRQGHSSILRRYTCQGGGAGWCCRSSHKASAYESAADAYKLLLCALSWLGNVV